MTPATASLFLGLIAALPAAAQENGVTGTDRAALSACLRESLSSPSACIGSIAVICARTAPEPDRRDAEIACARREAAVWRERLDAGASAYEARLDGATRSRFLALQTAWESYTVQKCTFFSDTQPAARAASMQAGCSLREIAARANEVERALRQRQPVGDRPGGSQPRIER